MKFIYSLFTLCFFSSYLFAQTPAGDDCATATTITVGSSCSLLSYSTVGATSSAVAPPGCSFYQGNDVWLKLTVPISGHVQIKLQQTASPIAWAIYSISACNVYTKLHCTLASGFYNINDPALGGTDLYVRVWRQNSLLSTNFSICAWETNPPSNDSCSTALELIPGSSCNMTTYSTFGATTDSLNVAPNPSCGFYQGGDVWFKVTVPASGRLRTEIANVSSINARYTLYTGTCGNLTEFNCRGANSFNLNNIALAGTVLYIRVHDVNNTLGGGLFNFCVYEPPPILNDFCADALSLPVQSSCIPSATYTTLGATSDLMPNPSCGFYDAGDVWFKFTVPASGKLRIERTVVSGAMSFAVYSGTCGNLTEVACGYGVNALNLHSPALANQTLYIRVWYTNLQYGITQFKFCLWDPNTGANDFCAQAITLPVNSTCVPSATYSTVGVTSEPVAIAPNPSCGFYDGGDLWFKFVMPSSGHARIERPTGSNVSFAAYTGTCGAMQQYDCAYSTSFLNIHDHSLAGQTIYIRAWYTNSNHLVVNFSLCVWEPNIPEYDFCSSALVRTIGYSCIPDTFSFIGATSDAVPVAPNPTCVSSFDGDLWFQFTMPLSGLLRITATGTNTLFQPQIALYSGVCGSLTQQLCSNTFFNSNTVNFSSSTLAGQTMFLRLWDNGFDGNTVALCIFDPSCILLIDSINFTPASCTNIPNATITTFASCLSCTGVLEYALDNGSYQTSSTFTNVSSGVHHVKVRDNLNPNCTTQSANFIVSASGNANYYYQDLDNDSYGNSSIFQITCNPPSGYVLAYGDCNDNNPAIHPGATEITCNGVDENCNNNLDDTPGEITILGQCIPIPHNTTTTYVNIPNGTYFDNVLVNTTRTQTFTIENTESAALTIQSINISGVNSTLFTASGITFPYVLNGFQSVSFTLSFTPNTNGNFSATIQVLNSDCDEAQYTFTVAGNAINSGLTLFQIQALIEGFYVGSGQMTTVLLNQGETTCADICDSITVVLHDPTTLATLYSYPTVIKTNGTIDCRFANLGSTTYYIELKHRNSLQIWSANPVAITNNGTYNFTTVGQTYGDNCVAVDANLYALYSGDVNQDLSIDAFDYLDMEIDIIVGNFGYLSNDVNGDGSVDGFDYLIIDPHIVNGVGAAQP